VLEYDFEDSIAYWVCMTARAFERALNEELAPHGITFPQVQVLGWLALEGELSQSQLAERLRVEPPTLAGTLDRMERDGWICRQTSPDDRRKKLVRPAPRVQPVWTKIVTCARRMRARAAEGIDPADLKAVQRTLAAIQENLKTASAPDRPRRGAAEKTLEEAVRSR
jgi:MarR family transcriptional regulator for hemolysin